MKNIGIEKIGVYTTPLKCNILELASHRGESLDYVKDSLLVSERSIAPLWEDSVTMAVNSAKSLLTEEDCENIGLLIAATETGLDQEKTISTWAHRYLNLPSTCRVFELKIACHAGAAALKMAESWIASGLNRGKKALILNTDMSYNMINKGRMEYSLGAGAIALLVSDKSDVAVIESGKSGIHTHEVTDVIRPVPWKEIALDVEASLFSYMDGLEYAFDEYTKCAGDEVDEDYFDYNLYHVPFPGMAKEAHKLLLELQGQFDKQQRVQSFEQKVLPSLYYPQQIGATYAGSIFLSLFSLIQQAKQIKADERIGIYSYGSGSCSEFFSMLVGQQAKAVTQPQAAQLEQLLQKRYSLSVNQYETLENTRSEVVQQVDFEPDFTVFDNLYENHYKNSGLLVLKQIKDHQRFYEFA
ncbi:hydroxymethylglutaryl-CoA synthase family protein [Candidatus Albibeggiatoa sp. nov. NOAA]|uniref:hydroxymethylglutaryl-CoA synthase family protein n=1 Tax=Candidatus Albibeggiatoa sp. nov. NOAA TaxID=3162724 RepID=UPI0032F9E9EF|nr:hydroxymethylglutaryl-CoA synthase family protein [Thiotrichaceae bacterium]